MADQQGPWDGGGIRVQFAPDIMKSRWNIVCGQRDGEKLEIKGAPDGDFD